MTATAIAILIVLLLLVRASRGSNTAESGLRLAIGVAGYNTVVGNKFSTSSVWRSGPGGAFEVHSTIISAASTRWKDDGQDYPMFSEHGNCSKTYHDSKTIEIPDIFQDA